MKMFHADLDRLGCLMVRQVPTPRTTDSGAPQVDEHGQVVHLGRVIVPGVLTSSYGTPEARQVRLKVTGQVPADLTDGSVIRLGGKVTVTGWYMRGARGRDARSEVTISPETIQLATGELPAFDGLLPVRPPVDDPFVLMQWRGRQDNPGFEAALIVPASIVDQAGTVNVFLDQQPADGLEGRPVRFDNLRVAVLQPEAEDAGRSNKSGFVIYADRLVLAEPVVAGASRRRSEPVAAEQNTPEG